MATRQIMSFNDWAGLGADWAATGTYRAHHMTVQSSSQTKYDKGNYEVSENAMVKKTVAENPLTREVKAFSILCWKEDFTSKASLSIKLNDLHESGVNWARESIELNTDMMNEKTLASGLWVVTLMAMPEDMAQRLCIALERLDTFPPCKFSWEDSRREGYSYLSVTYTWYNRSVLSTLKKTLEFEVIVDIFAKVLKFHYWGIWGISYQ
ncbi:hypothetical protein C8J57DRAFT_1236213 [Mycena rebaudengoi]|nr:hypothetical protein C8J57DRAFT_1236213 [Mycena rebaudengoi]